MTEEERRSLEVLFRSWAHLILQINRTRGPRLEALPKRPTPEQLRLHTQWIAELVSTCDDILWAMEEGGASEALSAVMSALDYGLPVPEDVRQPAMKLFNAWMVMFMQLRPTAINWANRLDEVIELDEGVDEKVAEWAEKLKRVEEANRFISSFTEHWTRLLQGNSEGLENRPAHRQE